MSMETYEDRVSEPEGYTAELQFVGNAAATPTTINYKRNMVLTWVSTGLYQVVFQDPPGNFIRMVGPTFLDVTPANAAGWTVVVKSFTAASGATKATLQFSVYNSLFALANVAATTTLGLGFRFKRGQNTL